MAEDLIKRIIKDGNKAYISHVCAGTVYYTVMADGIKYLFPIDMDDKEDVGTSNFNFEEKAITLMRYIRKAIINDELINIV